MPIFYICFELSLTMMNVKTCLKYICKWWTNKHWTSLFLWEAALSILFWLPAKLAKPDRFHIAVYLYMSLRHISRRTKESSKKNCFCNFCIWQNMHHLVIDLTLRCQYHPQSDNLKPKDFMYTLLEVETRFRFFHILYIVYSIC